MATHKFVELCCRLQYCEHRRYRVLLTNSLMIDSHRNRPENSVVAKSMYLFKVKCISLTEADRYAFVLYALLHSQFYLLALQIAYNNILEATGETDLCNQ